MKSEEDNQETIIKLQENYNKARELEETLNIIEQQLMELEQFKGHLKEINESKNNEILSSLGKGVFMKSEIKDKKLFVEVGSETFVRKTPDEAVETIEEQTKKLDEIKNELSSQINNLNRDMQGLMKKLENRQ